VVVSASEFLAVAYIALHLGVRQHALNRQQQPLQLATVGVDAPHAGDALNELVGGLAGHPGHHREKQQVSHASYLLLSVLFAVMQCVSAYGW